MAAADQSVLPAAPDSLLAKDSCCTAASYQRSDFAGRAGKITNIHSKLDVVNCIMNINQAAFLLYLTGTFQVVSGATISNKNYGNPELVRSLPVFGNLPIL